MAWDPYSVAQASAHGNRLLELSHQFCQTGVTYSHGTTMKTEVQKNSAVPWLMACLETDKQVFFSHLAMSLKYFIFLGVIFQICKRTESAL